ncbi:hypothetical protein ACFSTA_08125 [Ornithinibacillus salinisoli]|uniref:Uncharacterized protein n=1 Tax=Ornithinibacillus salinisoli TaxID=1848459 RepID=A0ABW4VYI8_9BACI
MRYVYVLLSLIFVLIFDLWIENSEAAKLFYKNWVKPILDDSRIPIVVLLLPVVVFVIVFKYWNDKKDEEIDELKKKLESEMEILVHANTDLSKYRLQDNLSILLDQFIQKHPYVIAVQIYHFQEQNMNRNTTFKINFIDGTVVEDVNINAIHQLYYISKSKYVSDFRKARKLLIEEDDPNKLLDFVLDTYSILNKKSSSSMNEEDACLCSLMFLGLEILEKDYQLGIESLGNSDEKIRSLLDDYRTGLLRGALMNDAFYTFTHTRENEKLNRQYLTRLVRVRDEQTLFLIALDASVLEDEDYDNIINNIGEDFEKLLINLENLYNRSIERVGD